MKVGIIGLGRMGHAIAYRLLQAGHEVIGYDRDPLMRSESEQDGIKTTDSIKHLATQVRIFWLMVPAGDPVDAVITALQPSVQQDDIIIDGGNSKFTDSIRRAEALKKIQVNFLDCGTSGGLHGKELGFSLMIGGDEKIFKKLEPIFIALAAPQGFGYMGHSGAGHYVKMVHNGIEYALLQAYAEGFHLLHDGYYKNLDLEKIAQVWLHGSIIRSWILELAHEIFKQDQSFTKISGKIAESGTGKWTVEQAHASNIPVKLIEDSLNIRAWSQKTGGNYATKLVALLRNKFGGHAVSMKEQGKKEQ